MEDKTWTLIQAYLKADRQHWAETPGSKEPSPGQGVPPQLFPLSHSHSTPQPQLQGRFGCAGFWEGEQSKVVLLGPVSDPVTFPCSVWEKRRLFTIKASDIFHPSKWNEGSINRGASDTANTC